MLNSFRRLLYINPTSRFTINISLFSLRKMSNHYHNQGSVYPNNNDREKNFKPQIPEHSGQHGSNYNENRSSNRTWGQRYHQQGSGYPNNNDREKNQGSGYPNNNNREKNFKPQIPEHSGQHGSNYNENRSYTRTWGPYDYRSLSYNRTWEPRYHQQGPNTNYTEFQRRQKRKVDYEQVSRGLAYILRHGAFKMRLKMDKHGFIYVDDILKLRDYRHVNIDDIIRIVRNNDKQRFHLQRDKHGYYMIGANQGHTVKLDEIELKPITDARSYPCVVHGTTYISWEFIKYEGLKAMGRTHIHFASGEPGEEGVISGMRGSSQVLIYIDLEKALGSGIKFFLSRNGVILSEGNEDGIINPVFFKGVIDRKTRERLA